MMGTYFWDITAKYIALVVIKAINKDVEVGWVGSVFGDSVVMLAQ